MPQSTHVESMLSRIHGKAFLMEWLQPTFFTYKALISHVLVTSKYLSKKGL